MAEKKEVKTITIREVAAHHKLEPRRLRVILRSTGMRAKDHKYEWKEGDAFLAKLPAIIKEYEGKEKEKTASKKGK
jgi:hypothetical protein